MKKRWQNPEYRASYSQARKGNSNHSADTKKRISDAIKAKWQDNEYRSRLVGTERSPEVRAKISESLKQRWEDPEFREKMMNSAGMFIMSVVVVVVVVVVGR